MFKIFFMILLILNLKSTTKKNQFKLISIKSILTNINEKLNHIDYYIYTKIKNDTRFWI